MSNGNKPMSAYDLHQELVGDKVALRAVQTRYCGQVRCSIYVRKASAKALMQQARIKTGSESLNAVKKDRARRGELRQSAEDTLNTMKYACGFQCKWTGEHYANWLRANGYAEMIPDPYADLGKNKPIKGNGKKKKKKKKKSRKMRPVKLEEIVDDEKSFFMEDRDPEDLPPGV